MRVNPKTMQETTEMVLPVQGLAVSLNDLISIKATGSLPYRGTLDVGNDFVRIWIDATDANGDNESVPLGTFMLATTATENVPTGASGVADMYSVLQILAFSAIRDYLTVPAGTNAVTYAASVVTRAGLPVLAQPSSMTLTTDANFEPGVSRLEIINTLLDVAGYDSADVDGFGNVLLRPDVDPTGNNPSLTFDTGSQAIIRPSVPYELDTFEVPNVIIAVMSNDAQSLVSVAVNDAPGNRYSTVSRGYEVTEAIEVSDIANQAALDEYARAQLIAKTTSVESVYISHPYMPYNPGDTVRVLIPGLDFTGSVASKRMAVDATGVLMVTETRVRRFVRF